MSFERFQWSYYLNKEPLPQSAYKCHYCGLSDGFYHSKTNTTICKNAIESLTQLKTQMIMIDKLLNLKVVQDVKYIILHHIYKHINKVIIMIDNLLDLNVNQDIKYIVDHIHRDADKVSPCIQIKKDQDSYLSLTFTNYSIVGLKQLIHLRQLKCPKNKIKMDHIRVLQHDLYEKRLLWRGISY